MLVNNVRRQDNKDTPKPLYNTFVGAQSRNLVNQTTVLYPNKNVRLKYKWSFFYSIFTFLGFIFKP